MHQHREKTPFPSPDLYLGSQRKQEQQIDSVFVVCQALLHTRTDASKLEGARTTKVLAYKSNSSCRPKSTLLLTKITCLSKCRRYCQSSDYGVRFMRVKAPVTTTNFTYRRTSNSQVPLFCCFKLSIQARRQGLWSVNFG